jgi:hypothetical protein
MVGGLMRQDRKPFDCYRETADGNYGMTGMLTDPRPSFIEQCVENPPTKRIRPPSKTSAEADVFH